MRNLGLMDPGFLGSLGGERDPSFSNVSLLLHGNGTNGSTSIIDSSPSPKTVTAFGNAQISTAQSRFGGGSIAFDGNGDYLRLPVDASLAMDSGNFTIEMWIYLNTFSTNANIFSQQAADFTLQENGDGTGLVKTYDGVNRQLAIAPLAEWFHFAMIRNGGLLQAFIQGSVVGSSWTNSSSTRFTLSDAWIGARFGGLFYLNAFINEFRITKGIARYATGTGANPGKMVHAGTNILALPAAPFPNA
jgi:hypothetical protein